MKLIVVYLRRLVVALLLIGLGALVVMNYSLVFAKTVRGEVLEIDRVTQPTTIVGTSVPASAMYSFAIAIKREDGEIFTASSEDRQWAVIRKGNCVDAKFYPYPPWNFDKADTYFNARLIHLRDCKPSGDPAAAPSPAAPAG